MTASECLCSPWLSVLARAIEQSSKRAARHQEYRVFFSLLSLLSSCTAEGNSARRATRPITTKTRRKRFNFFRSTSRERAELSSSVENSANSAPNLCSWTVAQPQRWQNQGMDNRTIQKYCLRKLAVPVCILAIDGDLIPINATRVTAAWQGMVRVGFQATCQLLRKEVVLVPVLRDPRVREPRQHSRARHGIVSWQNWFPHCEYANASVRFFL
jgi:hypothetical protein